jgi:hypothetical protein
VNNYIHEAQRGLPPISHSAACAAQHGTDLASTWNENQSHCENENQYQLVIILSNKRIMGMRMITNIKLILVINSFTLTSM